MIVLSPSTYKGLWLSKGRNILIVGIFLFPLKGRNHGISHNKRELLKSAGISPEMFSSLVDTMTHPFEIVMLLCEVKQKSY